MEQSSSIKMQMFPQLPETRYMPQSLVPAVMPGNQKSSGKVSCALCEYALHELQEILGDQKTEEAIKNALNQVCERLPKTVTEECEEYVRNYGDLIIALIQQEIDPSVMCVQLGLCTSSSQLSVSMLPSLKLKLPMSKPHLTFSKSLESNEAVGLTNCEVCHRIVTVIDSLLEDKPTEKEIVHAMENVCPLMPKQYYTRCTSILEAYGPYLLQYIGTMANSKLVCQSAGVCPKNNVLV
jgi:saposin